MYKRSVSARKRYFYFCERLLALCKRLRALMSGIIECTGACERLWTLIFGTAQGPLVASGERWSSARPAFVSDPLEERLSDVGATFTQRPLDERLTSAG